MQTLGLALHDPEKEAEVADALLPIDECCRIAANDGDDEEGDVEENDDIVAEPVP